MFVDDIGNSIELRLKILVVGEVYSGKTSFIEQYVNRRFLTAYKPTIGIDFGMKTIQYDNQTKCKLQLYDCSGQDRQQDISRVYYRNATGALILFDINCKQSFHHVNKWKRRIDDKVVLSNGKPIPCLLIANKCDIEGDRNLPSLEKYCKDNSFCGYFCTSAKEGININEAVNYLVNEIVNDKDITENILKKRTMSKEIRIEKKNVIAKRCC